ncbi:MAG: putative Mrp family protein [Acidimicrobiales bacterium]|nr:putative Mrp family protein [Acidimicrobiales bacterium]
MPTDAEIIEALRPVEDPELHRSIVDLGMVKEVSSAGGAVKVLIALTTPGCPLKNEINTRVRAGVSVLPDVDSVEIEFTAMSPDELAALRQELHGNPAATAGSQPTHGHSEGREIPFADPASRTRILLIASGKGGVGKSSVSTNLSIALAQRGKSVALVDADVWGFSIPRMLGVQHPPQVIDSMLVPPEAHGVRCMSVGFFADEDQAVVWRGPMLHKALEQFLTDVFWDDPDYLVIDLPPGTGDVSISIAQFMPRSEVFVVTTPQPAAQRVAQRAAAMAEKVNLPVRGIIENMSWFTGDDGKQYEIFGSGGGRELAERLEVPLLGQIPLLNDLREGSDSGHPVMAEDPTGEAGTVFASIAEQIDVELAPTRRYHPGLNLIES